MPELDKRVGDYAAAIINNVDLLLEDAISLNDQQRYALDQIKRSITRFMSLYDEYCNSTVLSKSSTPQNISFEFRTPLTSIAGYCELMRLAVFGSLTPDQVQYVQHIKAAHEFVLNAFNNWVNSYSH